MEIKVGTRNSKLALIQTGIVIQVIKSHFPDIKAVIVPIITTGDKITDRNLYDIGGKALFLKEIEEQLIAKNIDIAVHSLKDVPGVMPENLCIGAVLERQDPRDCFVSLKYKSLDQLPKNAILGTSSVRRKVIAQNLRPDIAIVPFRGNLNTRLDKLKNGEVDACILAMCGLIRTEAYNDKCHAISEEIMLPAAGQGVIAIEICQQNSLMQEICNKINHLPTWYAIEAERSFVECLDASCRTPLSAYATLSGDEIFGRYMLSNLKGTQIEYFSDSIKLHDAKKLGINAAKFLLNKIS
jgi:hydroxymethylbilane synthase